MSTTRLLLWSLGLGLGLIACGVEETGEPPPPDELYFPTGVAAHPDGRYLYIANSGFDRRYVDGTVVVYDTFTRRLIPEATVRTGLFAGELVVARFASADFLRVPPAVTLDAATGELRVAFDVPNVGQGTAREVLLQVRLSEALTDVQPSAGGTVQGQDLRWHFPDVDRAPRGRLQASFTARVQAGGPLLGLGRVEGGDIDDFATSDGGERLFGWGVYVGNQRRDLDPLADTDGDQIRNDVDPCPRQSGETACASGTVGYVTTRADDRLTVLRIHADEPGAGHLACDQDGDARCGGSAVIRRYDGLSDAPPIGPNPYGISLAEDGLYISHLDRGEVSRWTFGGEAGNPLLPRAECRLNLTGGASSVARHPLLGWAYVTDRFGQVVQPVESLAPLERGELGLTTREGCRLEERPPIIIDALGTGGRTRGLAFSADGTLLYVASSSDASLRIYDTSVGARGRPSQRLVAAVPLGLGPNVVRVAGLRPGEKRAAGGPDVGDAGAIIDQRGQGLVYVTAFDEDKVVVVDPTTLRVLARIDVGEGPHDLAFLPDVTGALRAYIANFREHTLAVLDIDPDSPQRFTALATVP